jgi:hypothetical protein
MINFLLRRRWDRANGSDPIAADGSIPLRANQKPLASGGAFTDE